MLDENLVDRERFGLPQRDQRLRDLDGNARPGVVTFYCSFTAVSVLAKSQGPGRGHTHARAP